MIGPKFPASLSYALFYDPTTLSPIQCFRYFLTHWQSITAAFGLALIAFIFFMKCIHDKKFEFFLFGSGCIQCFNLSESNSQIVLFVVELAGVADAVLSIISINEAL